MPELVDKRIERAVTAIGRAEIAQMEMWLGAKVLLQFRGDTRLADTGLTRDQNDLAVPGLGAHPTAQQQIDLLVTPDQWAQRRSAQRLKAARNRARAQRLPCRDRPGDALEFDLAEIAVFEQVAGQPAGAGGDRDRAGLG